MPHSIETSSDKIDRAITHFNDLAGRINGLVKDYKIGKKRDPETNERVYYIEKLPIIPKDINLIAGDVLHNVRSALDHIAFQLVLADTKGIGVPFRRGKPVKDPFRHIQFPIFDGPVEYASGKIGQIEGMCEKSIDAIDATEPYKGGTDLLWILHKLDILDKHRTLLTVGQTVPSAVVMNSERNHGRPGIRIFALAENAPELHVGQELFREPWDSEEDEGVFFGFRVAFNEPGIIQGRSLLETLKEIGSALV